MSEEAKRDEKPAEVPAATADDPLAHLDVQSLDLTVEKVEERISPSETNVFDK